MKESAALAAFDMDGTLIQGRLVFALADAFGLTAKVKSLQSGNLQGHEQTKAIANLFSGLTQKDLEDAVGSIPLAKNCEKTVAHLRERNYRIGIISDSYTVAAGLVGERLGLDFVAANELEIIGGRITGKVRMPLGWDKIGCFCRISVCKRYHLEKFARQFAVPMGKTVAVGDTKSDICMIKSAAIGVAFMPKDEQVANATNKVIHEPDLSKVLAFVE
jgi:phosphoserine phosphatase